MDYLPVVLGRGRPFLGSVFASPGSSRSVCPQGRLLASVNGRGAAAVYSLTGESSGRECLVSSDSFSSVQWVCPRQSSTLDTVLDASQSSAGQLVGVGRGGDVRWWRVREEEEEWEEGAGLVVEVLAVLKKTEMSSELGRFGYVVEVTQLQPVGSSEGCVLLLANSSLLLSLSLDLEFNRVAVGLCLSVEPSLDEMRDNLLPPRAGSIVDCVFSSPLFLQLCHDGYVFIHHVEMGVCVGVVNTLHYCHYTSGSQPESEELLTQISTAQFTHITVTSDLSQLAVATTSSHVLLVNLHDYFEVFPSHYHPHLLNLHHGHRGHTRPSSRRKHTESLSIASEEEEEIARYQGAPSSGAPSSRGGAILGGHVWEQRWKALSRRVAWFNLSSRQRLSFAKTSSCPPPPQTSQGGGVRGRRGREKRGKVVERSGGGSEGGKKVWYEGPSASNVGDFTSELPFVTKLSKTKPTPSHSNSVDESHSGSNDSSRNGMGPSQQKQSYSTTSVLPPLWAEGEGRGWRVVHVCVEVGRVVVYCGERGEEEREELGCLTVNSVPAKAVAVYQTQYTMSCSLTRCHRAVWVLPPPCPYLPYYLLTSHTLSLATFSLSQEQFVSKLLMYGSAVVAEEVCRLNRWDRCSLPINTLETALQLRQLDTVSFFLRSRDSSHPADTQDSTTGASGDLTEVPYLPPIPLEQLDTAIHMLLEAIRKNHSRSHTCPFASCLLIMTLAFITRLIKGQTLYEEMAEERGEEDGETVMEETGSGDKSSLLTENSGSGRYRTVSGTSVESVPPAPSPRPSLSLTSLTGYIQQLRAYLPNASSTGIQGPGSGDEEEEESKNDSEGTLSPLVSPPGSPSLDRRLTSQWNQMDTKEVVKDALLRGCLPLAQVYLLHYNTSSKIQPSLSVRESASLPSVLAIGSGYVLEALEDRSLQLASSLLNHMCMDVPASLRQVCFHTINRPLRDFLAGELKERGWLSESESQALDYLHLLESYHPLQSFEMAQSLHSQQQTRPMAYQSTSLPFVPGILTKTTSLPPVGDLHQLYPETFGGTHTLTHTETSPASLLSPSTPSSFSSPASPTALYLQVPLCVVLNWDTPTRQQLLYEVFVLKNQTHGTECEQLVGKEQVFDYVVRHNDSESALRFVMSRVPPLGSPSPYPTDIVSLCSHLPQCASHLKDSLLDELARQGVLIPSELPVLLARLGRTHSLFSYPHPLSKHQDHTPSSGGAPPTPLGSSSREGESKPAGALMSLEDFHSSFTNYCITNGFTSLLYHYLDWYSLALDESSISSLGLAEKVEQQPWVDTLLKFRLLALNSTEPSAVFQTSLACGRLLLRVTEGVVMEMLQFNRTLMALATLMYAPVPIEEALSVSSSDQPWHVELSSLKSAVAAYPTLQAALFPPPPTSLTAAQSQDISLYRLLQGTVPFDVSRLFKWQTTNTLATMEDTTDGPPVIPHFSQPELANRYARLEHLTYLHYLSRGQPSFAFANFVAAKLLGHSNTTKRIDRAVGRVYRLALQDFTNHRLVSSCAAFLEMADRESRLLRVDVQAAIRISRHSSSSPPEAEKLYHRSRAIEETQRNSKIASQFIKLYGSTEEQGLASDLLRQLETATHNLISSSSIDRCCLEAEEQWSLVQAFCGCHSLPPSTAFLTVCAEDGQWLSLLCHAQLHQIPPQKVLPIIEKSFSNTHIQEHLRLALSSMDPTTGPTTLAASQRGVRGIPERPRSRRRRANTRARLTQGLQQQTLLRTQPDIRAKLYSKIGLQRERSPQPDTAVKQDKTPTGPPSTSGHRTLTGHPEGEGETCPPALSPDNLPDDLFAILFKCQSHSCPWRALLAHAVALQRPLLAILAACNQDAVMVDCLCVWLYCTLGFEQLSKATVLLGLMREQQQEQEEVGMAHLSPRVQWHYWSPQDLALILAVSLQLPPSHTAPHFTLAFLYFDQNNPLLSFFKFHEQFTLYCNLERCKNHLLEFDLAMSKCSSAVGGYLGQIGDVCWVERLANMVTSHMLVICPTPFEREHLLRLLHDGTFGQGFQSSGLDFKNLYQMTEVLSQAGLPTDAAFTIREHFNLTPGAKSLAEVYSVRVRVDSDRVLSMLLEKAQFNVARSYATIVGSTANEVTVKEAEHNLRKLSESSYWQYEQARLNFWHSCNASFNREKVDPELAAEFFESVVHHSSDVATPSPSSPSSSPSSSSSSTSSHSFPPLTCSATERALLLAFALKWRRETDTMTADQLKEFEREIWRSHIRATVEDLQRAPGDRSGGSPLPFLPSYSPEDILSSEEPSSLLSALSITVSPSYSGQRNLAELALPDNVPVLTEASQGRGDTSSSLTDPQEVKAFNMMLGRLLNAGFISQARELAALFEHDSPDLTIVLCCIQLAQGRLSTEQLTDQVLSLVSTHSPRHLSELSLDLETRGDSRPSAEIVRMMQRLSDRAKHAQHCCSCITTCFKIAVCLHMSYTSVVTSDPFKILSQVLSCRFTDRYQLAKKFVSDSNLKSREVAGFLSECVAGALQSQSGMPVRERESLHSRVYYPQMTSAQFAELAQLCPDHNEVGTHLLSMAKSLSNTQQQTTGNITVQVELLVRAHDCYTLGCSVDGISEVLLVARQWVPNLILLKLFSLVVRLLTGIGRFYEMDYILQLLMENDQFESLLHTGLEKEEQLRVAMMDYLLTHHPQDTEKMQMVALKFGMFYELANTKQEQAKRDLRKIKPKHLASSNPETVKTLKTVFESLRTAAKTYSQEDYLSSAQQCYSLARLVALQLSLLHGSGNKQVINLDNKRVVKLMEELPFQEALIVADGYKRTSWTDWVGPLYKKVVIGGHFHYLSDYKTAFPLKANMFQELTSRYQHDRERPPESAANMRRLLTYLRNLPLKRKIATDLGLSDVLQSLSPTQDEGFLNDIARL